MAVLAFFAIVIALNALSVESNPNIIASFPNLMRVGNEETVLVSLHNREEAVNVTVTLKLFNNDDDEGFIWGSEAYVRPGKPGSAILYVHPDKIPSAESEEELHRYAYVTVSCPGFEKTKQVLLSYQEGFLFIQTDKPIYTPDQTVRIRVLSLDQYLTPSSQKVRVDIITPQDVIVKRSSFEAEDIRNGILPTTFRFHEDPMFGHWKIRVFYGKDLTANRTVEFEVKEYVLPTFSVKIFPPAYILPTDERISIRVDSRYVYDKPVQGRCFIKVGIKEEVDEEPVIYNRQGLELRLGEAVHEVDVGEFGENWFEDNFESSLYIEVTVVEDATGHFENASDTSAKFVRSPYQFTYERTVRYFKKGLPYEVKTDLKLMNGSAAPGVRVEVIAAASIEGQNEEVLLRGEQDEEDALAGLEPTEDDTNEKGQVNFRLYVPRRCTNIRIELRTCVPELVGRGDIPIDNNARLVFNIRPFLSPSRNEYLVLRVPNQQIRPDREDLDVDVFLNSETDNPELTYFVVARGKIVANGTKTVAHVDGLRVSVSYEMVPSARIVAYYISEGGDIISDSVWMEVERECQNPVDVAAYNMRGEAIRGGHVNPQAQIVLRVRGNPGTSVALLAVDKAVLLLRDYHRLSRDKMYGAMDEHDAGCGPGGGSNPADVFLNAGLMVVTDDDFEVPRREGPICAVHAESRRRKRSLESQLREYGDDPAKTFACRRGHRSRTLGEESCEEKVVRFMRVARSRYCENPPSRSVCLRDLRRVFVECCNQTEGPEIARVHGGIDLTDPRFISTKPSEVQIRNDFRESWAFDVINIPENAQEGSMDRVYSVPGSITTWSLQAFGLHDNMAMCVIDPKELLVFTRLFIQLSMPYSVVRNELVEIQATVFNYEDSDLVVRMFLEVPDEICSEGQPGDLSAKKVFEVAANDAVSVTYSLAGLETGEFPIKVAALTPLSSDIVVKMLRVEPEGVVRTIQHSTILNPSGARIDRELEEEHEVDEELFCDGIQMVRDGTQSNCLDISLPPTAVPDSASCHVSVTGNALGPILTSVISGLESWIRLPSGCGEQTMIRLAPNVYVLHYLTNTGSGTDADKARALSNTQSGIARELTYRHDDGSYSAWVSRQSSTWLTAFVGKVFCQASEYTFVDTKASCGAVKWLMSVQRGDGAFVEGLAVIHREMTGGVQGDAAMTAFALIAMAECSCTDEVPQLETSAFRATQFLESQLNTLQRPYVIAIVTYALALVGSDRRFDANEILKGCATYDPVTETRFWAPDASSVPANSRPYWYQRRPSAISVETTGYALLAQLELGMISYSHPIVKWLSQQQNYGGGFVSTQDTVIALQALSEYATLNTGGSLDMYCNVTAPGDFKTVLRLQEGDALVQRSERVPPKSIQGKLHIKTGGEGVGQLNVEVRYNDLDGNKEEDCPFDLDITTVRIDKQEDEPFAKDDRIRVGVCASYKGAEQTSMAILDVGLYTGFAPVRETLNRLVEGDSLINRTEPSARSVIFYADHIPVEGGVPLCFDFEAVCEFVVGNIQNAAVHVYDYYNPGEECTRFYTPPGQNRLGTLCQGRVCACVSNKCAACSAPDGETANDLLDVICDTAQTYAYKIVVTNITEKNGFTTFEGMIETVIKRGDDQDVFINVIRYFVVSTSCECPEFRRGRKYMVIGRNYLRYEVIADQPEFKYIIDHTTIVRPWRRGRRFEYLQDVHDRIRQGLSTCT